MNEQQFTRPRYYVSHRNARSLLAIVRRYTQNDKILCKTDNASARRRERWVRLGGTRRIAELVENSVTPSSRASCLALFQPTTPPPESTRWGSDQRAVK